MVSDVTKTLQNVMTFHETMQRLLEPSQGFLIPEANPKALIFAKGCNEIIVLQYLFSQVVEINAVTTCFISKALNSKPVIYTKQAI